jgi:hypothetical protein
MAGGTQVEDREAAIAECDVPVDPYAVVIGTTVLLDVVHPRYEVTVGAPARIVEDAAYSAHGPILPERPSGGETAATGEGDGPNAETARIGSM